MVLLLVTMDTCLLLTLVAIVSPAYGTYISYVGMFDKGQLSYPIGLTTEMLSYICSCG